MARRTARPEPERERSLRPLRRRCPSCGERLHYRYNNHRTVTTLQGLVRLRLKIHRCDKAACSRYHRPYRPEGEGAVVLPQHEFGLDVIALVGIALVGIALVGIALVGALRYREHRSVPEIHRALQERGVAVCERTVTNLLDAGPL